MAAALTITSLSGLESVDHRLATQYQAMTAQIQQRLSPHHAFLFARPEPALEAERVAWFIEDDHDGAPLSDFAESDRDQVLQKLRTLEADLRALVLELNQGGPDQKILADLISNALERPSNECVWVVAGKPVLVNWGFRELGWQAKPRSAGVVMAEAQTSPAMSAQVGPLPEGAETAAPKAARSTQSSRPLRSLLLWILFVLLLGVSVRQLLLACALLGAELPEAWQRFGPGYCPSNGRRDERSFSIASLRNQIAEDERYLIKKAVECQTCITPPPPQPAPVPQPTPPPPAPPPAPLPLPEQTKRGKLEISLIWSGETDLDLIVACPDRSKLTQDRPNKYNCGGEFVLDMNHADRRSNSPVEHVIWERDEDALPGDYRIQVNPYDKNGKRVGDVPFEIVVTHNGQPIKRQSGTARQFSPIELIDVFTLTLPLSADSTRQGQLGERP